MTDTANNTDERDAKDENDVEQLHELVDRQNRAVEAIAEVLMSYQNTGNQKGYDHGVALVLAAQERHAIELERVRDEVIAKSEVRGD